MELEVKLKKSQLYAISFFGIIAFHGATQARTSENVVKDVTTASSAAVATYKKNGTTGLILKIQDCYKKNKTNAFYCVHLDVASRHVDHIFVESMQLSPTDFFSDEQFFDRIIPIIAKKNQSQEDVNKYFVSLTQVINDLVEKNLFSEIQRINSANNEEQNNLAVDYSVLLQDKRLIREGCEYCGFEFKGKDTLVGYAEMAGNDNVTEERVQWISNDIFLATQKGRNAEGCPPRNSLYKIEGMANQDISIKEFWTGWPNAEDDIAVYRVVSPEK
jgi:hypothetical protein